MKADGVSRLKDSRARPTPKQIAFLNFLGYEDASAYTKNRRTISSDVQKGAFGNDAALQLGDIYYTDANTAIDAFEIIGLGADEWFEAVVGRIRPG
jgi:hypothetical protein